MLIQWKMEGVKNLRLLRKIPEHARKVLREAGHMFIDELDVQVSRLKRSQRHGFLKRNDRRTLLGSFKLRSVSNNTLTLTTPIPWAAIVDEGGIIEARGKKLTVPLSGVGMSNDELQAYRASGRTFAAKNVIFLKSPDRTRPVPIFALKSSVTIPASYYSTKAILKATPKIMRLIEKEVEKYTE